MIERSLWQDSRNGAPYRLFPAIPGNNQAESVETTPDGTAETAETAPEDPWAVWPYSWAHNSWNFLANRFHSFHEKQKLDRQSEEVKPDETTQPAEADVTLRLV